MSEVHIQSISNNNYEVIKKTVEMLDKVANARRYIKFFYNIHPEDILLIEFFEEVEEKRVFIYLRNGLKIKVNEKYNTIEVERIE